MTQIESQNQQIENTDQPATRPQMPAWPTSKPGPEITEPPLGMKRVSGRSEQVVEVGYDQVLGKSTVRSEKK